MLKKLIVMITVAVLIAACTIKTNVNFNEDFSGNIEYVIDMSEMMAGTESDSTEEVSFKEDEEMQQALENMEKIEGISNAVINEDLENSIYQLTADFADLDALNRLLSQEDMTGKILNGDDQGQNDPMSFDLNKKKMTVNMIDFKYLAEEMREASKRGDFMGLESLINYEVNISFNRPIKKVKTNGIATQNGNSVSLKIDMESVQRLEEYDQDMLIIFE